MDNESGQIIVQPERNNTDVKDEQRTSVGLLHRDDDISMSSFCDSQQNTSTEYKHGVTVEKSNTQNQDYLSRSEAKSGLEQCHVHASYEYLMHCNTCQISVCDLCVNTLHKDHDFSDIGEVMAVVHRDIQTYQDEIEKEISLLEHSHKKDDIEFEEWCATLETEVNRKRNDVEKTVDIVCDELLHRTIHKYKDVIEHKRKEKEEEQVENIKLLLRRVKAVQSQSNSDKISFIEKKEHISDMSIFVNTRNVLPELKLNKTDINEVSGFIGGFHEAKAQEDRKVEVAPSMKPDSTRTWTRKQDKQEDQNTGEATLHKAEYAWKPSRKQEEMSTTEKLYRKVRSILNKLTPQKFQTLVEQMSDLEINTEEKLKGVVDLVFEKAISEPEFIVAYASMCRYLTMIKVPSETKSGDVNFRAILLTRCQRKFEKDKEKKRKEISENAEIEKGKIGELKAEVKIEEAKARRRYLGNIRFFGELFKLKMLTENIMHACLFKLLRAKDEEGVCVLLCTIGRELDTDKARPRMDQYFNQIEKIVSEKKSSFMLQDVIELRLNKWVPKGEQNNPKTLDQIRKESLKKEQERQIFLQQAYAQKRTHQDGISRGQVPRGSRGPPTTGTIGYRCGFTVGTPNIRVERQSIDPCRLNFSKQNFDELNIQIGGGANRFSGLQRGSTSGGARNSQETKTNSTPNDRYGVGQSPTEGASRESSRGREQRRGEVETVEKPAASPAKQLTNDEMEKKTKTILDEYLHIQDIKEAILCVEELNSPGNMHVFVSTAVNHVIERSKKARNQTGLLLHDLVKKNILKVDCYIKGLTEILQFAEDFEIETPNIWQNFGELIGPMVQDGSVALQFLRQAAGSLQPSEKSGLLVAEVLHAASHREGHKKVGMLWRQSSLQWNEFMPAEQVQQFLKDKKLEFTEGDGSQPSIATVSKSIEFIQEKLDDLLRENSDNEGIFDWIEENVDVPTIKSRKFVRALMTAVCQSAITGSGNSARVVPDTVKMRGVLLQKYLDHQAEFELQALYAVQALVYILEHPPGVLRTLFDTLYDEDIISEDAFNQWEKSNDPAEQEGKELAMKQVVQFFTWLREMEDFSDS